MKYQFRLHVLKWNTFARVGSYIDFDRVEIFRSNGHVHGLIVKVMPDEASVRQDSLRQDSLRQRVAYRAPGFERSCAQNGRKTH